MQLVVSNWKLSEKQRDTLVALGERLKDIHHEKNQPDQVIRFILARPRSIDAAEKMFRNMIQWRLDNKVDTILQDYTPPRLIREYMPGAVIEGYDKDGDPIYVERIGSADSPEMVRRFGEEHLVKHAIWIRELASKGDWVKDYERTQQRPVRQLLIIEDLKGLNTGHLDRHLLKAFEQITRLDQDNYPEFAKKICNVNAPFVLRVAWSLVKHFFDHNVAEKMVFASHNHTVDVLSKYIDDLSILPKEVVPMGTGKAVPGLNPYFEGGPLPPIGSPEAAEDFDRSTSVASSSQKGTIRKETAATDESHSPEELDGHPESSSDEDDDDGSTFSNKSTLSWATPVRKMMHKRELKQMKRKQREIEQVREEAARRLQPKTRSQSQQDRLKQLRQAKRRRQERVLRTRSADARSTDPKSTPEKKSWSEKLTDRLSQQSKNRRVAGMIGWIIFLFSLLNPELVYMLLGIDLRPEKMVPNHIIDTEQSTWVAQSLQGISLFCYMFLCAIVHFGVMDIALVNSFLSLNLGSKTGHEVKKYYSDVVRMGVAVVSLGIFAISIAKALVSLIASFIVACISQAFSILLFKAKSDPTTAVLLEKGVDAVQNLLGNVTDEAVHDVDNVSSELLNETSLTAQAYNASTSETAMDNETLTDDNSLNEHIDQVEHVAKSLFARIKSMMTIPDLETVMDTWQADTFATARMLFSYTCVFLLVFLFLFHNTVSPKMVEESFAPKERKPLTKAPSLPTITEADLEDEQEVPMERDDEISDISEVTSPSTMIVTTSLQQDQESSSSTTSKKSKTSLRRRFRFRRKSKSLSSIKENS